MQIVFETDEAWSLMSVITSWIVDQSGISQEGKQKLRRWRGDRAIGTVEMDELAVDMNKALGTYLNEKTERLVRRRGRYVSTKDLAR